MKTYTYDLEDPKAMLSRVRQGLFALGGEWEEVAPIMLAGTAQYRPRRASPMRSGYRFVYQRAKLDLTVYFPEQQFEHLHAFLDAEKLALLKGVFQAALPKRSGYDLNEFVIRGIIDDAVRG